MWLFAVAIACAFLMGVAIQRGGTCAVAAVEELLTARSARRLLAIVEAAGWVTVALVLARALGFGDAMMRIGYPFTAGYDVIPRTVVGGILLGVGAVLNGACAFGTVARLGSGEWSYVATPFGFLLAALLAPTLLPGMGIAPRPQASSVLTLPAWLAAAGLLVLLARLLRAVRRAASEPNTAHHTATTLIGIAFVVLLVAAGPWSYTDAIVQVARGMSEQAGQQLALFAALLAGAFVAGRHAWSRAPVRSAEVARRLAGGAIMGIGAFLVPGSNDALLMLGMPLLWPHAWVAFTAMGLTIAVALRLTRRPTGGVTNFPPGRS